MEYRTALERVMGDALLRNNLFFDEQVYVKTDRSFYQFDYVVYGDLCKVVVECDGFQHELMSQQLHDSIRDLWTVYNSAQSVLRFTTFEIYLEVEKCIERIINEINTLDACLIDEDGTRRRMVEEEKERVRNKKTSYFYKNRPRPGLLRDRIIINDSDSIEEEKDDSIVASNYISAIMAQYDHLPGKEKIFLETLITLEHELKKIAWHIIKSSNKGKGFYSGSRSDLKYLCMKGIFVPQRYTKKGTILLVLPFAPNLLNELLKNRS